MQPRLRASLAPLFTSLTGERGVMSLQRKLPFLDSFPFEVEGLRRSLHESANEDDDLLELGKHINGGAVTGRPLRLMTKKADFFKPIRNARKNSASASSAVKVNPNKKVLLKPLKPSSSGYIKNPILENSHLPIDVCHSSEIITIGISNICAETHDYALHTICSSCGPLLRIIRTGENTAEAFFSRKDGASTSTILERLNYTIMDDSNWSAALQSEDSAPAATKINDEDQGGSGLEIVNRVQDLERELTLRKVYCEDFLSLHRAIMRLKSEKNNSPDADQE